MDGHLSGKLLLFKTDKLLAKEAAKFHNHIVANQLLAPLVLRWFGSYKSRPLRGLGNPKKTRRYLMVEGLAHFV
jgi:hypothetical protein